MTRGFKILLALFGLSLALNVFAVGHVVGKGMHPKHGGHTPPMGPVEFNMRAIHKLLPDDAQASLKASLQGNKEQMRASFKAFRQDQRLLKDILSAETFDKAAFEEVMARHEREMKEMHAPMRAALVDILPTLDQPTRAAIAEVLFNRRGGPKHSGKD